MARKSKATEEREALLTGYERAEQRLDALLYGERHLPLPPVLALNPSRLLPRRGPRC